MSSIVTLTANPAVDKSCEIEQIVPDRKLRCSDLKHEPGGGGLNVARAIKKLGGDATAYWTCGGAIGELLRQLLEEEGISQQPMPIAAMSRENLIVFEQKSDQQFRFGMPGAKLSTAEVRSCIEAVGSIDPPPDYLVLSGSLPPDLDESFYARIAQSAPESCRVVLDTSGAALRAGLESSIFLLKPNINELGQLAGREIEGDAQIREVAQSLITNHRVEAVLTSLGSGGAFLTTAEDHTHIRAPTVRIRSKVGAGDSTVAGLVYALASGKSLLDAVAYGVAAGSAAVMTAGTELCRRNDTERLYEETRRFLDAAPPEPTT